MYLSLVIKSTIDNEALALTDNEWDIPQTDKTVPLTGGLGRTTAVASFSSTALL